MDAHIAFNLSQVDVSLQDTPSESSSRCVRYWDMEEHGGSAVKEQLGLADIETRLGGSEHAACLAL